MRYPYYLQTDDEAGEVRLMQDGVCVARGKSRNALAKIRDVLNAPTPLEGAWVEMNRNNHTYVGVVQSVAPRRDSGFKLLVRTPDDLFETWAVGASEGDFCPVKVIDRPDADEEKTS